MYEVFQLNILSQFFINDNVKNYVLSIGILNSSALHAQARYDYNSFGMTFKEMSSMGGRLKMGKTWTSIGATYL